MPGTGSYTYLIIQKVFWWSAPFVIFYFCQVASIWSKMVTDLHQSLRLLDNPAGQSRHRERRGGKASEGWSGFCHQGLKSADSGQELVLKLAPPWCSGHDSCQRLGKAGLDGPSVTTSGIGAAASASAAASVVFASFPAELQIQVQSACSGRVAVQTGKRRKLPKRAGLKVVTIEIIKIVTTIIVTTFKHCNNLNML